VGEWESGRVGEWEGYQVTALGMATESCEVQRSHAAPVAATQARKQGSKEGIKEASKEAAHVTAMSLPCHCSKEAAHVTASLTTYETCRS